MSGFGPTRTSFPSRRGRGAVLPFFCWRIDISVLLRLDELPLDRTGFDLDAFADLEVGQGLIGERELLLFFHGDLGAGERVACHAGAAGSLLAFLLDHLVEAVERVAGA